MRLGDGFRFTDRLDQTHLEESVSAHLVATASSVSLRPQYLTSNTSISALTP